MEWIILTTATLLASIIAALPFGLVNLTVLDVADRKGPQAAIRIAGGATLVEILFVLIAFLTGPLLMATTKNPGWFNWVFVATPLLTGLYFLRKRSHGKTQKLVINNDFIRGAVLNLVSIQVLLYWVFAIAFLKQNQLLPIEVFTFPLVILVIAFGKIWVLWMYARLSNAILQKLGKFSSNINRIIGIVLILTGVVQYLKL